MTKYEFLSSLQNRLSGLPQEDVEERLHFYGEMIEDRMEEGLLEAEAVSAVGSAEEIAGQIIADIPLVKIAKETIKPKRQMKAWEIVLLTLGSPLWISLLAAAFAVLLSLYAVLWSVILSLWAVFAAVAVCSVGCNLPGLWFVLSGKQLPGIAVIGIGILCMGLAIFLFYGCRAATKGLLLLSRKILMWVKRFFMKKEEA